MNTVNGLPAHIILVHAVVVLLPLAAILLVLTALWPGGRRRLAGANAILAVGAVALVPLTTDSGEWLERRVDPSALLKTHTELGDTALWVAIPVAVLAIVIWWRQREMMRVGATGVFGGPSVTSTRDASAGGDNTSSAVTPLARTRRRTWLLPASAAGGIVIAVLAVVAASAAVYDVYRIGDSGAQAVWKGTVSDSPKGGGGG